jgi:hypothetical protein
MIPLFSIKISRFSVVKIHSNNYCALFATYGRILFMRSVVVLIVFMLQFLAAAERHKPTSWFRHCFSCCTSAPVKDELMDVQAACVSTSIVVQPPAAILAPSTPPSQERLKAALGELEHVINTKNGSVEVSDYTSSVASIIRSDFARTTSAEVRGRIHDLMHSLAGRVCFSSFKSGTYFRCIYEVS